jgi:CheY-like chemotaxis protein
MRRAREGFSSESEDHTTSNISSLDAAMQVLWKGTKNERLSKRLRGLYSRLFNEGSVLLIDDNPEALEKLTEWIEDIQEGRWRVLEAESAAAGLDLLKKTFGTADFPDLVSVDLCLPPEDDEPSYGLALLRQIHDIYNDLPLMVHSSVNVEQDVLHTVMAMKSSFIRLGEDRESQIAFALMLPFLSRGYLLYSALPASNVPQAIRLGPDPLNSEEWDILSHLARVDPLTGQVKTIEQISIDMNRSSPWLHEKIRDVYNKLVEAEFVSAIPPGTSLHASNVYRPKLEKFFNTYAGNFGRLNPINHQQQKGPPPTVNSGNRIPAVRTRGRKQKSVGATGHRSEGQQSFVLEEQTSKN